MNVLIIRFPSTAREGDQDSRVRALRDCEADAEGTRDDDDGDELNDQKDQDHLNIQRSFKFNTNIGQDEDEDALPKNHITIQNHNGDGLWLWGISP